MNGRPVVEAVGATRRYGEVVGLNGFTARFPPGITGLIGPNGAGKSTLFRAVTGQVRLDAGSLSILGEPAWDTPMKNAWVGYCPEHANVYSWLTPTALLRSLLGVAGYSPEESRARSARALEQVGLVEAAHRPIREFSKGMRQRVKLAQALAHEPRILLLDEPFNGLDPVGRVKLTDLFRELASGGVSVVVSSHVLYEVERLTSQVVLMSNGRSLAEGDLHRIRDLLDQQPHTVELETSDPRAVAARLAARSDILEISFPAPRSVRVRTDAADAFFQDLPGLVTDAHLPILGVRSLDDDLESLFRYLVGGGPR